MAAQSRFEVAAERADLLGLARSLLVFTHDRVAVARLGYWSNLVATVSFADPYRGENERAAARLRVLRATPLPQLLADPTNLVIPYAEVTRVELNAPRRRGCLLGLFARHPPMLVMETDRGRHTFGWVEHPAGLALFLEPLLPGRVSLVA